MQDKMTALEVFLSCFTLAALGGFAALLRSGRKLTWRAVTSSTLYSGLTGLVIGLTSYNYFDAQNNTTLLLGASCLAGLAGMTAMDFAVQTLSGGGFEISFSPKKKGKKEDDV